MKAAAILGFVGTLACSAPPPARIERAREPWYPRPSATSQHIYEDGADDPNRVAIYCSYPDYLRVALDTREHLVWLYCKQEAQRVCPHGFDVRARELSMGFATDCGPPRDDSAPYAYRTMSLEGLMDITCRCPASEPRCLRTPTMEARNLSPSKPGRPLEPYAVRYAKGDALGWCCTDKDDYRAHCSKRAPVSCAGSEQAAAWCYGNRPDETGWYTNIECSPDATTCRKNVAKDRASPLRATVSDCIEAL